MSRAQLETLYSKIGANNPNLQYNGPFLHLQKDIGGFNEWSVLTYNLQLIAKYIKENSELRNKYEELLKVYNGKQPQQQQAGASYSGGPTPNQQNSTAVISMMLQRIEDLEKKYNSTSIARPAAPPSIYTPSWTGYGQLP